MKFYTTFLYVLAISFILACRSSSLLPSEFKGDQIHFGQGGGFTGMVTYFILLDDARLFQKNSMDSTYTEVAKWENAFTRQMFDNYKSLSFDKVEYYHPGNLYYFIEHHAPGKEPHRISWGKNDMTPPENVVNFYNLLFKSTKSKS